jgi:serine/threonine protein kinase
LIELDDTAKAKPPLSHTATAKPAARAVASAGLAEGMRLGHFQIVKPLGAGGMGEVYLATDLALDRQVALKVLPGGVGSATARDRLVREARAQARVQHTNVAHIYFIGEDAGLLYFAMELVGGRTLAQIVEDKPLPADDALAFGVRSTSRVSALNGCLPVPSW